MEQDATTKILTILGQRVTVNADTNFDDDDSLNFASLSVGDVLEVSGYQIADGFIATHIEIQGPDTDLEIKGVITDLTDISFKIKGFPIEYDLTTELDDIEILENGLLVEVEGMLNSTGNILLAEKIESKQEEDDDDDDIEIEIEGVISGYDVGAMTFVLQGQMVDGSDAILFPESLVLVDGLRVEAEGDIVDGVLVADKIKQKGQKIKVEAYLSAVDVDAGLVSFEFSGQTLDMRVNHQTALEDDINDSDLLLSGLAAGQFVEVKAFDSGNGDINIVKLELEDGDDGKVSLQAPIDSFDSTLQTVNLLGIRFDLSMSEFEIDDEPEDESTAEVFFNQLSEGVFIKVKDKNNDGVIDEAEIEDDD